MEQLYWGLALLLVLIGLAGTVLPLLPGVPLLFTGLWLAAWNDGYRHVGAGTLGVLALLTLLAWLADYLAAVWSVRRAGAGQRAMLGAGVGGVLGMFGGWPGLLLGPLLGALLGERSQGRSWRQAWRAGLAASAGLLLASLVKLLLALLMLALFAGVWWLQAG